MALLEIKNIDVFYGKIQALKKISLKVEEKECVGVIGPNGAGKSSLLDSVIGLTDRRGQIFFDGAELSKFYPWDIPKNMKIGYVTERRKIFTYMSVKDNLLVGAYNYKSLIRENLKRVFELFPILEERQNQEAGTLSGGEQQMLALGKALMANPKMLLLDEPTLGLAPIVVSKISDALNKLIESGVTILIAEQNVAFTLQHAKRIYVLENGEIIMSGTTDELKSDEYVRKAYFGIA